MTYAPNPPERPPAFLNALRDQPLFYRRRFTAAYIVALVATACLSTAATMILHGITNLQDSRQVELAAFAATLITLVLEALFIFLPVDRQFVRYEQALITRIAEQARVQDELRQSETRYRLLVRNLPDVAILMFDRTLRYTLAEGPFLERAGFQKQTVEGRYAQDVLPSASYDALMPSYCAALNGETTVVERAVGDLIHFTRIVPVRDESGDVIGGMILAQDVTRERQIEAQLRESEEQYRSLFQNSLDAVMLTETGGEILRANSAACQMLGYTEEEITALGRAGLVDVQDPHLVAAIEERARTGHFRGELTMIRRGNTKFPVEVSTQRFAGRDGVDKTSMVIRDISDRKLAEQRRIDLALEQEKVRILSNFITSTSHDLRTPLSVISTNSYLCRKATTPEQQHNRLDNIDAQVRRLNEIIEQLHQMASLDSALELRLSAVNVNEVAAEIAAEIGSGCESKQIQLEVKAASGLPAIQADRPYLKEALLHIAENAVQFTPAGGSITVSTACDGASVLVTMLDTGIGIGPDHLPHIFERFYKGDSTRNDNSSGAGLGLTMAKRIIDEHQGTIEVRSQVGQGTRVLVWLPTSE